MTRGAHALAQAVVVVRHALVAADGPGAALDCVAEVLPCLAQRLVQGLVQRLLILGGRLQGSCLTLGAWQLPRLARLGS